MRARTHHATLPTRLPLPTIECANNPMEEPVKSVSADALAMASFSVLAAMCARMRDGSPVTWAELEPMIKTMAATARRDTGTANDPKLQADLAYLLDTLTGPDPWAPRS